MNEFSSHRCRKSLGYFEVQLTPNPTLSNEEFSIFFLMVSKINSNLLNLVYHLLLNPFNSTGIQEVVLLDSGVTDIE